MLKSSFLYRHFKVTNHSPSHISIQPVEKILYDDNFLKKDVPRSSSYGVYSFCKSMFSC